MCLCAATKNLIVSVECTKVYKNVDLISPLPNVCIPCVEAKQKETNIALSIPFRLLNKAIFGLGDLEFCQKMRICMLDLVMAITHFCPNLKYLHLKCVSCNQFYYIEKNRWPHLGFRASLLKLLPGVLLAILIGS